VTKPFPDNDIFWELRPRDVRVLRIHIRTKYLRCIERMEKDGRPNLYAGRCRFCDVAANMRQKSCGISYTGKDIPEVCASCILSDHSHRTCTSPIDKNSIQNFRITYDSSLEGVQGRLDDIIRILNDKTDHLFSYRKDKHGACTCRITKKK
jgi:hypothetical protein